MKKFLNTTVDCILTILALLGLLSIPIILSWLLGVQMAYEANPDTVTSWDGLRIAIVEIRVGIPYIFGGLISIFIIVFGGLFILQPIMMAPPEKLNGGM